MSESDSIRSAEFELRYQKVRDFLHESDLGAILVYSPPIENKWGQTGHVSYLSGWANHDRIVDSAVVVPARGRPVLLFAGMPYMREQIAEVTPLEDIRLVRATDPQAVTIDRSDAQSRSHGDFASETLAILEKNGLHKEAVGVVGIEHMPVPFYEALCQGLGARMQRVRDIVAELRSVKSPDEIAVMRRAARLSDLGFETMLAVAKPGMRGIEVVAEMERTVRREGADHAKYWMASGRPDDWASTRLDIKPHLRVLEHGDLMAACSYVLYRGYWCHGHRTGTLGKPSAELDRICNIARQAQDAGLSHFKAGEPVAAVAQAIRERAAQDDFALLGGRIGHGMGMDYSEQPAMSPSNTGLLKPGMTAVIHATFALPGSNKMFVPLGDVCQVTADGPEFLMKFPRTPFLIG